MFLAGLIVLAASVWLIFDEQFFFRDPLGRHRGQAIGYIHLNQGDVRFKEKQGLDWTPARRNQSLIYDDSIFVGEQSNAVLKVGESEIEVGENSLIVLRKMMTSNILNLSFGHLTGQLSPGEKLIIEGRGGKHIEVNATEKSRIIVNTTPFGDTKVQVISGKTTVSANGKTKHLIAGSTFEQSRKAEALKTLAKEMSKPEVISPADGYVFKRDLPTIDLSLEFKVPKEYPFFWYQIFEQNNLEYPFMNKIISDHSTSISIPDGHYVIRVRGVKSKSHFGEWSKSHLFIVESKVTINPEALSTPLAEVRKVEPMVLKTDPPPASLQTLNKAKPQEIEVAEKFKPKPPRSLASEPTSSPPDTDQVVQLRTQAPVRRETPRLYSLDFNFGLGSNYIEFAQNGVEVSNLHYASIQGPSFSISTEIHWANRYGAELSYAQFPGRIQSSVATLKEERFNWTTLGLEGKYRFPVQFGFGSQRHFGILFGAFHHRLPYVQTTDFDEAEIRNYEMTMATLGGEFTSQIGKKLKSEVYLRYAHPLSQKESNGDSLLMNTQFAFDGSIGAKYLYHNNFNIGLFWYGQFQKYRYSMINAINGDPDSGTNSLFFSNLELRMGYSY